MGAKQSTNQPDPFATPPKKKARDYSSASIASSIPQTFTPQHALSLNHPTKEAFTVENCLTPEECAALIKYSQERGYEQALLNAGAAQILATDTRKSERCMIDNEELAEALYARIKYLIPATMTNRYNNKEYQPVGLNERLRFLRYTPGDYFVQHMDGTYARPTGHAKCGELSMLTYLVYLNQDYEGGALVMEWQGEVKEGEKRKNITQHIQPKTGIVVVHDHRILHEAMVVTKGTRYCIRTDVMFAPKKEEEKEEKEEQEV